MRRAALIAAGLALVVAGPVLAQERTTRPIRRKKPPVEVPAVKPPPPVLAQEKPLVDLAEVMGALALLHQICVPAVPTNPWRVRMTALVEAEGDSSGAREKMIGAFNQGFSDYATSYRQCTEAAQAARGLLTRDAARLARDLERRFGS